MNYYVFIDNFRGFRDTCIPITDVNFLVGENSTGKTSLLGLLKLFSGPEFWMGKDFGDEQVGFTHFADMVSVHSHDSSHFRIGFASIAPNGKKKASDNMIIGSLFTFIEKEGQPKLFKCTFSRGEDKITLRFGKFIYFKREKCAAPSTVQEIVSTLRGQWVVEHASADVGYKKLQSSRGMPLFVALSFALSDPDKPEEFSIYPPNELSFHPELIWFAPIRTKAKRTYDELTLDFSPEGQHTPYLIRKIIQSKTTVTRFKNFIDRVGEASGLFQDVSIRSFGRGATARFELDIVLDDKALNVLNVGYGVSQSLPVLVELLVRPKGAWFAIQQPEIHLHPRAQAALGDVLFEMAAIERKHFLIETHSDFMIDRFRLNYKKERASNPDSQILFFERRDKHNLITPISIEKSGELAVNQPDSYRQFFIREQMNVLGI